MTNETLITEGQNQTEADQQQAASTQVEGQPADGGAQTESQQQAEGQQAKSEEGQPEGAPEKYEFKPADGSVFDDTVIGAYSEVAKELNLSQDAAQKVLDKVAPAIQARQFEKITEARTLWAADSKADKEFGGDKFDENMAVAKKARDAFATPALVDLLNATGLGDHPEINRFFYRAGKAISEDRFVQGEVSNNGQPDARRSYPKTKLNP